MQTIVTQLHGYRQGHQLLDGKPLSKIDQGLLDRLSDLAGPLRPGETFSPYLSGYPLPSGSHYVLARTWQDLGVARAGCVRTLSLIIPMQDWAGNSSVAHYFDQLVDRPFPESAEIVTVHASDGPIKPVTLYEGREMLEALFLEDSKPVVVFAPPEPETIAVRLLSALWPDLRKRFSISTFALSPRRIEKEFFNLVFAPRDAKSRFTNWPGRRIDARAEQASRHRWTSLIVDRVFRDPRPSLLEIKGMKALNKHELSAPSALRISLLWDELLAKLHGSPSAALGLLDVANSKFSDAVAVSEVMPLLTAAVARACVEMEPTDGWAFVTAMLRKVQNTAYAAITPEIASASRILSRRAPIRAVSVLEQSDPDGTYRPLLPAIATGLRESFDQGAEQALSEALPETLVHVLGQDNALALLVVDSPTLLRRLGDILPFLSQSEFDRVRRVALPLLHNGEQFTVAKAFLPTLSIDELLNEVDDLADFADVPADYAREIVCRGRALGGEGRVRDKALELIGEPLSSDLLESSLGPSSNDARWVLERLPAQYSAEHLHRLMSAADGRQLSEMLSDHDLARKAVSVVGDTDVALLLRVATDVWIPTDLVVAIVETLRGKLSVSDGLHLTKHAAQRCLRDHFGGDEVVFLCELLDGLPASDADWVIHQGLVGHLNSSLIDRNVRVFDRLKSDLRKGIIASVDLMAEAFSGRWKIDLDADGANAFSNLLAASEHGDRRITLQAAALLMPALIRSRDWPISPLIVVAFPHVYAELAREDDIPDIFRFIPFLDWDRCKAARHELVDAFLSTEAWRPQDFAYTAWRCRDIERFIKRLLKDPRGRAYVRRIEAQLATLPVDAATQLSQSLAGLNG